MHDLLGSEAESTLIPGEQTPVSPAGSRGEPAIPRGRRIGQYEIVEEIGRGGMGVVYKARQIGLGRIVALKMILSPHAGMRERARFRTEAEAAARLQHPNIVQIHEVGEHDGCLFLSMEFVEGGSLADHLAESPPSVRSACEMVEMLAQAMHYAHQRGIVHRDLKPANILLECGGLTPLWIGDEERTQSSEGRIESGEEKIGSGKIESGDQKIQSGVKPPHSRGAPHSKASCPKITDFGLAKWLRGGDGDAEGRRSGLTQAGSVLGTPSYMAPEQAKGRGDRIGPTTDVYALGAILYEMLSGRPPFRGETALETLEQIRSQEPVSLRRLLPTLPRDLETVCLKCLEKEPHKRYASGQALADDLRRFLDGEPIRARPVAAWERAAKWARRRPAVATLLATIVAVSVLAFATVTWAWLRAETNRIAAVAASEKAETALVAEQAERERVVASLYFHDIALAHSEYWNHDIARANQLLAALPPARRHWEWHYLNRLCNGQLLTFSGHTLRVWSLAYSPDGQRIASGSAHWGRDVQGEVKVWDANTGQELFSFRDQPYSIMSLAFSPDATVLASASVIWGAGRRRGDVRVRDLKTGQERLSIPCDSDVFSVAFSPDGRVLAMGCSNGIIRLCDSSTGKEQRVLAGHGSTVFSVCFSPDGAWLASGSNDSSVRVWDARDGRELKAIRIPGPTPSVRAVSFSSDGAYLAAATYGGTVTVFDAQTGSEVNRDLAHGSAYVAFGPADLSLAVATSEEGIYLLQALTGARKPRFPGHRSGESRVVFSLDGRRLVTAGADRLVRVWDVTAEPEPREMNVTGDGNIADMAYSPDGRQLAVVTTARRGSLLRGAMTDKTLRTWDMTAGRQLHVAKGHTEWLTCVAYSPDGRVIATGSDDKTVRLWNAQSGEPRFTLTGHTDKVTGVAFGPDGSRLVSVSLDKTLRLWDAGTGQELDAFPSHDSGITSVAWVSDGRHVIVAGENGKVTVWNVATRREHATLRGHAVKVHSMTLSRDAQLLATADASGNIHIWDFAALVEGRAAVPRHSLQRHVEPVTGLSFSPDGNRLASVSSESVTLWDAATGQEILAPRCQTGSESRVQFSPDGRQLAVSAGIAVRILDSTDERPAAGLNAQTEQQRTIGWHEREAKQAQEARDWFGAAYHLSRLIEAQPDRRAHYFRRGQVNAGRANWQEAASDYNRTAELRPFNLELALQHAAVLSRPA